MQLIEIKVSKNVGVLCKTSGNVKLISCLALLKKNSMGDALKSFYFCKKKSMHEKEFYFYFIELP